MIYKGPGFLAVVWFGSSPTPFLPLSRQQVSLILAGRAYWRGVGGGEEQIIRPRESLVLYKSFNTFCFWLWRRAKLVHKWKVSFIITHKSCKTDPLNFAHYYIYYIQSIKEYGVLLIFFLRAQFYGRSCLPCMEGDLYVRRKGLGRDQVDHFRYCMYTVYLRFIFSLVQVITW